LGIAIYMYDTSFRIDINDGSEYKNYS
jgi:hypothetical protein